MKKPKRDFRKALKATVRTALEARRNHARRLIEREQEYQRQMRDLIRRDRLRLDESERLAVARIELEIEKLAARIAAEGDTRESIMLKAELAHLSHVRQKLLGKRRRKPPESGLPVPAVPPGGPLPKQGGAEATLDFEA